MLGGLSAGGKPAKAGGELKARMGVAEEGGTGGERMVEVGSKTTRPSRASSSE